jgi:stage V sporulation protein S
MRVSTGSDVRALAGAIAGCIRRAGSVRLELIGAGALNQAVKAAIVAREMTGPEGFDVVMTPSFCSVEVDGHHRTALHLLIDHRERTGDERAAGGP